MKHLPCRRWVWQASIHQGWMGELVWQVTVLWLSVEFLTRKLFLLRYWKVRQNSCLEIICRASPTNVACQCSTAMQMNGNFRWYFMKSFSFLLLLQPPMKPGLWFSRDSASTENTFLQYFYHSFHGKSFQGIVKIWQINISDLTLRLIVKTAVSRCPKHEWLMGILLVCIENFLKVIPLSNFSPREELNIWKRTLGNIVILFCLWCPFKFPLLQLPLHCAAMWEDEENVYSCINTMLQTLLNHWTVNYSKGDFCPLKPSLHQKR